MNRRGHSYLDLTALPRLGALLLDPRPAFLFAEDGERLWWTNVAGVRLLREANVQHALERRFAASDPAATTLATLARSLRAGEPQMAVLPFGDDAAARGHFFICARLSVDDDNDATLVTSMQPPLRVPPMEDRASELVASMAQAGVVAVLAHADGRMVAASPGFTSIDDNGRALADFAAAAKTSGRGLLKRRALFGDDRRLVGMAAVSTPEGEFMLALIGPAERPEAEAPVRTAVVDDDTPAAAAVAAASLKPEPPAAAAPPMPGPAEGPFIFRERTAPVRFVFQLDAENRFTHVSPEFASVVGSIAADIVGKSWNDVARGKTSDTAEVVTKALARRDTWSGVTVYWPIQDSDDAVAVDLAALPAFTRNGGFDGFRGFGVCRTNDLRRGGTAAPKTEADQRAAVPSRAEKSVEGRKSNVVVLPSAGAHPQDRVPPTDEHDAFRRIAEALRSQPIRRAPPVAKAEPDGVSRIGVGEPSIDDMQAASSAAEIREPLPPPESVPARLLDRTPIGIVVFRDQRVLFANRPFLDRLGYADAAALETSGGVDALFLTKSEPTSADAGDRRNVFLRTADGGEIAVEARLHVVPWGDGAATMLSVRTEQLEVTDKRRQLDDQQAALARIDELEAVLDTATDGVVVLDAEARIISLNKSAEALFGVEATDVLAKPFTDLLAEESRRSAMDYLDGLAKNGVASVLNDGREVIGRVPSGGLIPLFMTMGRLAERGKFCAVLRDITHWKNAEEELIAARRSAEMASQQKSEFLAKVSHEIRTPLNAVIGFSEVMLDERFGPIGNERYRQYLKDIRLSGTHLLSLINDLLDLSKIEAGKLDLSFAAVPVNEIIQECVALMQPEANRRRIIIRTSLAGAVPKVVADPRSLRQIVLNLLSNAVKFTLAGGQVIVSTALDDNGEVVIRIRDTGIGMSEKELETALKPFKQLATSNPGRQEGTGLGLPLTKALVEANRATFAIDSTPHQGTMARVIFPTTRVLPA